MVKAVKLQKLLENAEPVKTISKSHKQIPKFNQELVDFMKEMYARIVVDICYNRVHDEDSGCDVDCVGLKKVKVYKYLDEEIKVVYTPVAGNDFGWVEESIYYMNFPKKIKFSQQTLTQIKIAFEEVRQKLLFNYNELRHKSGGKWFEQLQSPVTARRIMHLFYDLYYQKDSNGWKMKFRPGEKIHSACGGRWCPYDVQEIYDENAMQKKEEEYKEYAEIYNAIGYESPEAN